MRRWSLLNKSLLNKSLLNKLLIAITGITVGNFVLPSEAETNRTVQSINNEIEASPEISQRDVACPSDVTALTEMLLRDIPNYTNRVLQRTTAVLPWTEADRIRESAGEFVRQPYRPSHVIIAGQADLTPLDLSSYTYTTDPEAGGPLTQLFFTTLSRQYSSGQYSSAQHSSTQHSSGLRSEEVQEYHWLFLAPASDGWRLAFMFSEIDNPQTEPSPIPPRESSQSSVGQALQIWLRDCRAGTLRPLQTTPIESPIETSFEAQIEQLNQ